MEKIFFKYVALEGPDILAHGIAIRGVGGQFCGVHTVRSHHAFTWRCHGLQYLTPLGNVV